MGPQTPASFRFAVKAHRKITHRLKLRPGDPSAAAFVEACEPLGERLGPILFQVPKTMRRDEERLRAFFHELPRSKRYALEVRHPSWFAEEVYSALREVQIALVRSDDGELDAPDVETAPFAYGAAAP
ncbi:MAG: DUF72 domain-containing protein [Planctomycetes bacterium]|nr:DUF72 domain-containing protein [Planctomycetota bacterium]